MLALLSLVQILGCSDKTKSNPSMLEDPSPPSVVIIGGGASGMATAIRLIEHGISPVIIEKEDTLGGAGIHAGRFFAVESNQQKEMNVNDSLEQTLNEWQNITGIEPDEAIEDFLSNSATTLEWIESYGVHFTSPVLFAGNLTNPTPFWISSEDNS